MSAFSFRQVYNCCYTCNSDMAVLREQDYIPEFLQNEDISHFWCLPDVFWCHPQPL